LESGIWLGLVQNRVDRRDILRSVRTGTPGHRYIFIKRSLQKLAKGQRGSVGITKLAELIWILSSDNLLPEAHKLRGIPCPINAILDPVAEAGRIPAAGQNTPVHSQNRPRPSRGTKLRLRHLKILDSHYWAIDKFAATALRGIGAISYAVSMALIIEQF